MSKCGLRLSVIASVTILAVCGASMRAFGWNPLVHYIIATAPNVAVNPTYANLPDAWPSQDGTAIALYFCWTHAVLTTLNYTGSPFVPDYPDDGRYPEFDMYILAMHKMRTPSGIARRVTEGFACHNGADRVAHWEYFPGGSIQAWWDHRDMEIWAEYVVFASRCGALAANGDIQPRNRVFVLAGPQAGQLRLDQLRTVLGDPAFTDMHVAGDANLLRLAQLAYRKNGRQPYTNQQGSPPVAGHITVESEAAITGRLTTFDGQISGNGQWAISRLTQGNWDGWNGWYALAQRNGYDHNDCVANYNEAITMAGRWLTALRSQ